MVNYKSVYKPITWDLVMLHPPYSSSSEKIPVVGTVAVVASTKSEQTNTTVKIVQWGHYLHMTTLTVSRSQRSSLTTRIPGPSEPWQLQVLVSLMLYSTILKIHHLLKENYAICPLSLHTFLSENLHSLVVAASSRYKAYST